MLGAGQAVNIGGQKIPLDVFVPVSILLAVLLIIVELPAWLLDTLLITDIVVSILIILMSVYVKSPLDFAVFPTIVLVETIFRLGLNIASTRLILAKGHIKDPLSGEPIGAGHVIPTFAKFVAGNKLVIGFVLFLMIVVVQFIVITQGAERIAQVAARFTLDAMPMKQMAIDGELHAGLITPEEAKRRRREVEREADFYGAMDGVGKFVKGDTIANIIILAISIIGGILMGFTYFRDYFEGKIEDILATYTLLTIGNGLVSILPSFLVSTAMGIIVSRAASESNLGEDVISQLTAQPRALQIAAGATAGLVILSLMGMGLPILPLLGFTGLFLFLSLKAKQNEIQQEIVKEEVKKEQRKEEQRKPETAMVYTTVETLSLELGKNLLGLVDESQGRKLLERIPSVRITIAKEVGIVMPGVHVTDNMDLRPNNYVVKIKGVKVGQGEVYVNKFLAIGPENVIKQLNGNITIEPAYGMPGVWIEPQDKPQAERLGCMLFDAVSVIATHLTEIVKNHAADILGRQETTVLVENLKKTHPAVVKDVIPEQVSIAELQRVLQNLLRERIPVRDLVTIIETLNDAVRYTRDIAEITEFVRIGLANTISYMLARDSVIYTAAVDPMIEQMILNSLQKNEFGTFPVLDPNVSQSILMSVAEFMRFASNNGYQPIILTSPTVRRHFRKIIERNFNQIFVISFAEVAPNYQIKNIYLIKAEIPTEV
ncbi:MAG: flagellar biosynthesis protein FlhA [Candidatus Calescibacterium sp.]|nr:flagellar biosynthesis protein FlhA [Candidatus Calescibacterium sp.]MDW8195412.1 flagellar biosynthesis protein FlhA [Candidatus Calescibacterium sp.]